MSWFDTSSFSSFAKTALTQAQKSIDRVLDIEEGTGDAASRSSASSKQKPVSSSVSEDSPKETFDIITRKSSSSSSGNAATKSSRKTSSNAINSKDNDGDSNSFWSSFLGDSFSTSTTNTESKTPGRRTAGRKPGSRVTDTATGKKGRSSIDRKEPAGVNSAEDKDDISSSRALKQHKMNGDNDVTNTTKSDKNLQASDALLPQEKETGNVEDLANKDKKKTVSDIPKVKKGGRTHRAECDKQDLSVTPDGCSDKLASKHLKHSSSDNESWGDENKECNAPEDGGASLLNISAITTSKDLQEEELNTANEEPVSLVEIQSETMDSFAGEEPKESLEANESAVGSINQVDGVVNSQDAKDVSVILAHDESSFRDSTDNVTVTNKAGHDNSQETADQQNFFKVEPLASSTPNHFLDERSDKETKSEEALSQETGDCKELLKQTEGVLLVIEDNDSKSPRDNEPETDTGMVLDAVPVVQNKQLLEDSTPQQETGEVPCVTMKNSTDTLPLQQLSMKNEGDVTPEDAEEREKGSVEDDANLAESSEDLKRKIEELQNEVTNLKHVVEVRENKLVQLSKENVDLQETATILRSQLMQAEDALEADDTEIEEVREEFTVRVAATEKKFQAAAKERDQLKACLEETEKSLNSRNERQHEEFTTLLKEKDDQIAQLLAEGEKLSKQELQINNTVKKLRAKEKENEALIKKNSKALEEMTSENARLTEILKVKEDTERKQADAITKLNAYVEKQEEQVSKLRSELDDAAEKLRSMQTALDNAYKQLADLHKENASKDSAAQEAALSAEMIAKEELRIAMEKKERQFKQEIETLEFQISDLQTGLRRGEQQANRREDNLRQEISDLQQRLQEAEARNQELTESVTHATRPLLRQIENLQSSYGNHTQTWERVERNLTERLNEAQIQLAEAQEKERVATEHALELKSRVTALESQLVTYRQEKSRLEATLELERTKLDTAEDARSREAARAETLEIKYRKMMEDNNVEKALLEQQLAVERSKMETERKRFQNAMDEKERSLLRQSSLSAVPPSPSAASEISQDELPETTPRRTHVRQSSGGSIIDSISRGLMGSTTAMVERLQAQVKQKDGEIELLQDEISSLQKTRDSLTEELTSLSSRTESLERATELLTELRTRHKELEQRHNAVLQMYGEKAEECEELRMDLEDVKSMYKSQIQELLGASR